jgi:hypothetical protein
MHTARWRVTFFLFSLACIGSLVWLMSSSHRVRLIAGSYEFIDSSARLPDNSDFRFLTGASSPKGFMEAMAILRAFDSAHPPRSEDAMPGKDQPDTCLEMLREGHRTHCYNTDIGAAALLAQHGIQARLWDLKGPKELGGYGHNVLELYDGTSQSWKVVDPYYYCYYTVGANTNVADFATFRRALLTDTSLVHIVRFYSVAVERPDPYILSELQYLAPASLLHENNDFRTRYQNRYAWLNPLAPLFDQLSLRTARGVRMMLLGSSDRRYFIQDRFSPQYPIGLFKFLFWALLTLAAGSFILFLWSLRSVRRVVVLAAPRAQSVTSSAPRTISTL